jgi:hypothetical protein
LVWSIEMTVEVLLLRFRDASFAASASILLEGVSVGIILIEVEPMVAF